MGDLFILHSFICLFICSIICLCKSGIVVVYFMLGISPNIDWFILLLKLFQLRPWELCVPLICPIIVFFSFSFCSFLSTSLLSNTTKWFRLILYILCSSPIFNYFSKKPQFLSLLLEFHFLSADREANVWIYILIHEHAFIHKYFSIIYFYIKQNMTSPWFFASNLLPNALF